MSDTSEIVKALVRAFNVNNRFSDTVKTNFTLQSRDKKDYIAVLFDKNMDHYQRIKYLSNIKRKIVSEFYGIEEEDTDEVVLNTANLIFDVKSFPFNISEGKWSVDEQGRVEFVTPVDEGAIFNLKSHLASSIKKDVLEDMKVSSKTLPFNKNKYLWHDEFSSAKLCKQFESEFSSRVKKRYKNVPKGLLKVKGNDVYIRDVFDDVRFIDSIIHHTAWLVGRSLQADSRSRSDVKTFKNLIIEFIDQSTGLTVTGFMCAPSFNGIGASILIPVALDGKEPRVLTYKEAFKANCAFGNCAFCNIHSKTQAELSISGSSWIYGINFYDPEISYCVITKIIESSVINKDHELSIDPELRFRALSPEPPVLPIHENEPGSSDGSPEKEQSVIQRTLSKLSRKSSKESTPVHPTTSDLWSHNGDVYDESSFSREDPTRKSGSSGCGSAPSSPLRHSTYDTEAVPEDGPSSNLNFSKVEQREEVGVSH